MSTGTPAIAKAFFLTVCIAAGAGCNLDAEPPREAAIPPVPEARYQVDAARNRIWVLTQDGVSLYDVKTPRRTAIALPEWVSVDEAYACLPALALGPRGEALITSNVVPTLWRIDPETLAVTLHPLALDADADKDVGFSALAYSAEHAAFFALSYAHGSLWRIDPLLTRAQKIALRDPVRKACRLAVRPRGAQQRMRQPAGLCVRTPQEVLEIDFAPGPPFNVVASGAEACG